MTQQIDSDGDRSVDGADTGDGPDASGDGTAADMLFEDTLVLETTAEAFWSFVSDAENLYRCVPGAKEIEQVSERKYTGTIERGVSRLTITLTADVELVEMDEPEWIVADGDAFDSTTGSTFDGLAAMELTEVDEETVELSYAVELSVTGGAKRLTGSLVRSLVDSTIETYFENIRAEVE